MEEKLVKYFELKNKGVTIEQVASDLGLKDKDSVNLLEECLKKLEISGKLYVDQNNKYMKFPDNFNLAQGKLKKDDKGNYYIVDGNRIYINSNYLNGALEGDTVLINKDQYSASKRSNGQVRKIIARDSRNLIFECKVRDNKKFLIPINEDIKNNIYFENTSLSNLVDGSRVLVEMACVKTNGKFLCKVINEIGHKDDPDIEIKQLAIANGISVEFSKSSLDELANIPNIVTEEDIKGRTDLRNEEIFTIDGNDTKDIDDAISLKINERGNYVLGVHIADVAHYVRPGSSLFNEAIERSTSVYLTNYVIPMLPHKLSNGICSLNPNEDRLAKSCVMEIDKSGKVIDYSIFDSVIKSKKKMNYNSVNMILDDNMVVSGYEDHIDTLKLMKELYLILDERRIKQGRIDFASNELKVVKDKTGKVIDVKQASRGSGEKLIENFMVLANETIASNYSYMPFVYRVHDMPDSEMMRNTFEYIKSLRLGIKIPNNVTNPKVIQNVLQNVKNIPEYEAVSDLILRGMKKAYYDTNNIGHFALASDTYTHFTSPIRRINDLIVHSLIDFYNNSFDVESLDNLTSALKDICIKASNKEKVAEKLEREVTAKATLEFLNNNIGKKMNAKIIYMCSKYVIVKLENGITGEVKIKSLENIGYSYRASSNTLKCRDSILGTGSDILITIATPSLNNNKIVFNYAKEQVKQLQKTK